MAILQTFLHLIERNERQHPRETAMRFDGRCISFAEHGLRDRLAMLAMNCPEYAEFYGVAG